MDEQEPLLSDTDVSMSIENGSAWVSVYDVSTMESGRIQDTLERLAESILSSGLARSNVCLRCGRGEGAELMFVEGRPTRLCSQCLGDATAARENTEAELNVSSYRAALSLPFLALASACIWALFWFSVDLALNYFNIDVIEIHYVSMALILGLLGVVGWALGQPLGKILRRTPLARRAPRVAGTTLTVALVIAGEILYAAVLMLWAVGVFDLVVAPFFALEMLLNYSGFWIFCKLVLAAAVGIFCCTSAAERKTVSLEI